MNSFVPKELSFSLFSWPISAAARSGARCGSLSFPLLESRGLIIIINNDKLKISITLFPDVIKSALQKFHIKLNTILNGEKGKKIYNEYINKIK